MPRRRARRLGRMPSQLHRRRPPMVPLAISDAVPTAGPSNEPAEALVPAGTVGPEAPPDAPDGTTSDAVSPFDFTLDRGSFGLRIMAKVVDVALK